MKKIAIITARGGSKRIPRKNIRDFLGKPIMAYSIQAALDSGLFDEVMVSTDDEEIAQIARQYGANVPFMRSAAAANDFATTADVLNEVLGEYKKRGQTFDYMCCIYPCAPLVTGEKLAQRLCADAGNGRGFHLPHRALFLSPPARAGAAGRSACLSVSRIRPGGAPRIWEPIYHDAGQFYFYKLETYGKGTAACKAMIELSDLEVQDIDNLEDREIAEMKYGLMMKKQQK